MQNQHNMLQNQRNQQNQFQAQLQNQSASTQNLEVQIGQIANSISSRPYRNLPSDMEQNPRREGKEQCKAITLRNGKELNQSIRKSVVVPNPSTEEEVVAEKEELMKEQKDDKEGPAKPMGEKKVSQIPPLPFPQRFQKQKLDKQFSKFLEVFKKLHINIPFAEALEQMPSYVKFMKEILSKKRKLEEFETVALTEECSAILQQKLPPKLKDPGSFTIPCRIGENF